MGHSEMGDRLVRQVLAEDAVIHAVICNGDIVAHGVLAGLKHLGRRIPDDIAVVGFGENPSNSCLAPNASTIMIGEKAADPILGRAPLAPISVNFNQEKNQ